MDNHDVCITHLKWSPCLTKNDWEGECKISDTPVANDTIRRYHGGVISFDEAALILKNIYGDNLFVRNTSGIS